MDEMERRKALRRQQLRKRKKRIQQIKIAGVIMMVLLILVGVCILLRTRIFPRDEETGTHPKWEEDFLTVNKYSRPGIPLKRVENIFVHYTANPGTSARQNRDYFNNLGITGERYASAHFIIGYEGEIIQCVPLDEIAYAVKGENHRSISIECCHLTEDGSFTPETYDSLIELLRWLTDKYGLEKNDILRHYDSNGKLCPLYYVEHEDEWERLKNEL